MSDEHNSEAPTRARDLDLKDHIRDVERAAADWGVHVDALEGRFIGALLAAIRESLSSDAKCNTPRRGGARQEGRDQGERQDKPCRPWRHRGAPGAHESDG